MSDKTRVLKLSNGVYIDLEKLAAIEPPNKFKMAPQQGSGRLPEGITLYGWRVHAVVGAHSAYVLGGFSTTDQQKVEDCEKQALDLYHEVLTSWLKYHEQPEGWML